MAQVFHRHCDLSSERDQSFAAIRLNMFIGGIFPYCFDILDGLHAAPVIWWSAFLWITDGFSHDFFIHVLDLL